MTAPGAARGADVLHLDMDCFYAAVEVLDDPTLAGRAVIVGGTGNRGVVSSASYEARGFGVHSAMPTAEARRLCPNGVWISPRHGRYAEVSSELGELMRNVTPLVEPISLDEAFLDVSGAHRLMGSTEQIARRLRDDVHDELGLSCSVGGGSSKLIAKLASEAAKPVISRDGPEPGAGVIVVAPGDELAFLHAHHVRAVPGIGPRTAERLARLGISTVGELATLSEERLAALFGKRQGHHLHVLALGVDERVVEPERTMRSIGHEETFEADRHRLGDLVAKSAEQAGSVAARCRSAGLFGRTVSVKVKYADFTISTRSRTLDHRVTTGGEIAEVAAALLAAFEVSRGVRLLGVSVSNLEGGEEARQLVLFEDADAARGRASLAARAGLEGATDEIRERYGAGAIGRASPRRDRPGSLGPPPRR